MCKNIVEPDRPQMTTWRIACPMPKATDTQLEYLMLIAFPLQQWLHERTSMLRYTCIACLVPFSCLHVCVVPSRVVTSIPPPLHVS